MGFLKGAATCRRWAVEGGELAGDGLDLSEMIVRLSKRSFAKPLSLAEGGGYPHYGWCGNADPEDGRFEDERMVRGPFVAFSLAVRKLSIPQSKIAARARQELEAMALDRPPRPQDRRDAARAAKESLAAEAAETGKYLKDTAVPVVYDSEHKKLWLGTHSHSVEAGFAALVSESFGSAVRAVDLTYHFGADGPPGGVPDWLGDGEAANGWGNVWAEAAVRRGADASVPPDASFGWRSGDRKVQLIPRRTLTVRCPLGKGLDRFDHELPYSVPELADALRAGMLPTAMGLDFVGDLGGGEDVLVPFSFVPHAMAVSGARIPKGEAKSRAEGELDRLYRTRNFLDLIDGAVLDYVRGRMQ